MEIEAKFSIRNVETFQCLRVTKQLSDFSLSTGQAKQVYDTYLDTEERQIMGAGFACRRRKQPEGVLVTLKGLGGSNGPVHRREELEIQMPDYRPPEEWPASPVRDQVLKLIGTAPLVPLLDLQQIRFERLVSQDERLIAELTLDGVHLAAEARELSFFELEVELAPQGTEADLTAIVACLQDEWNLEPETRSKFERALAFLESDPPADALLTPQEQAICVKIATRDDTYGRRATALLALDEGATQVGAGERAGLSARQVRRWLAEFRNGRLGIFPQYVLDEAEQITELSPIEKLSQPTPEEPIQPVPLEVLNQRYQVDQSHARRVADHALALFDFLAPFHSLPAERRSLLETAALVHNIGLETDPDRHHVAGRDILLAYPPESLDEQERLMVALITFLHRKRITRNKLNQVTQTSLAGLEESAKNETLAMAALIRMADGLDFSQTSSTRLGRLLQTNGLVEIEVEGPQASLDAKRAQKKSDLWRLLFEIDVQFIPVPSGRSEDLEDQLETPRVELLEKPPKSPGLEPSDSMAEAARKTFWVHFRRMLYHEPGTRLGEDIEELHDMRVATRRMRAAFQVFGGYLDLEQMAPFLKGLRRTGRALGAVRDLDVFWEKTQHYLDTSPPERLPDLSPLRAVWEAERERARERMLAYLNSKRYARFTETFSEFLQTPGAGALPVLAPAGGEPVPHRLRHVVPVAVYQRLAAVWAYDEWVTGPNVPLERLHQLRIAAKGLRYTLEYFQEVLGPEAKTVIDEVKALQDHLGDLQDAVVASNLLRDFLTWGTWGHKQAEDKIGSLPTEPVVAPGVAIYLASRQTELQQLLDTFPSVWERFHKPEFSQLVTLALAPLFASNQYSLSTTTQKGELLTTQPKYIVLLGPPASGKGTQAAQLREALNLPHVASGDLFRENLKNETELGMKAKAYIDRGELVPDDLTIAMVIDRLSRPDCTDGALLDGFPRTITQAEALDRALAAQGHRINKVAYIAVPDEVLVKRVSGRRICRVCGESYHVHFNPPRQPGVCNEDGGELYQRDDDKPETVRQRLKVYWEQTSPLIDYYRKQGVLVEIDGDQSIEAVQADLRSAIADD